MRGCPQSRFVACVYKWRGDAIALGIISGRRYQPVTSARPPRPASACTSSLPKILSSQHTESLILPIKYFWHSDLLNQRTAQTTTPEGLSWFAMPTCIYQIMIKSITVVLLLQDKVAQGRSGGFETSDIECATTIIVTSPCSSQSKVASRQFKAGCY